MKLLRCIKHLLAMCAFFLLFACKKESTVTPPNIIWLTCEDISPMLSCYGDSTAHTPNIDNLASESMVFTKAFATVGVCAPARSSIITGMYPTSIGTMHMRTGKDISAWGLREYNGESEARDINGDTIPLYSAVIPEYVKCFTEYLRLAGYYCTNNQKTDYQFAPPPSAWNENGSGAHWKNAPEEMPFFAVFNHEVTHESRIWVNADKEMTVDPEQVPVPDYFPDNEIIRNDIARVYSNIELLDKQIGQKLEELKEAGLLDNSIIFFFSDHGGPLPRGKREHYDSGLNVPFMVRFPNGENAGYNDNLISFVDLAPTMLSLAGVNLPEHLQGTAFLGEFKSAGERSYIFGSSDRFDENTDRMRCVRDKQFMYIRNYYPEMSGYKRVTYRENVPMMNELLKLHHSGNLNNMQLKWFESPRPVEELYDCNADPFQLNNLASDSTYSEKLAELRIALENWQQEVGDMAVIPEKDMLEEMWPGGIQPNTENPVFSISGNKVEIYCPTNGASIAYIISDTIHKPSLESQWSLYKEPITLADDQYLYAIACRIGYRDSEIVSSSNR